MVSPFPGVLKFGALIPSKLETWKIERSDSAEKLSSFASMPQTVKIPGFSITDR